MASKLATLAKGLAELPYLTQDQANMLRTYLIELLGSRGRLRQGRCQDLAVTIVAQFPVRVKRG